MEPTKFEQDCIEIECEKIKTKISWIVMCKFIQQNVGKKK